MTLFAAMIRRRMNKVTHFVDRDEEETRTLPSTNRQEVIGKDSRRTYGECTDIKCQLHKEEKQ